MPKSLKKEQKPPRLLGVKECAAILGVSRQRVSQLALTETFPKPVAHLASGPIWETKIIEQYCNPKKS